MAHGQERPDGQTVGAATPASAAAEAPHRPPRQGPPDRARRHPLGASTGSPWRALPERSGSWKTVSSRFYRWQTAGVWDRLGRLRRRADAEGRLDWTLHFVDSTVVRAHQHAAGAKGGPGNRGARPEPRRLQHQDPPALRAGRQTGGVAPDRGPAARAAGPAGPDGARRGQAAEPRTAPHPTGPRGRGQGLQQPRDPVVPSSSSGHKYGPKIGRDDVARIVILTVKHHAKAKSVEGHPLLLIGQLGDVARHRPAPPL